MIDKRCVMGNAFLFMVLSLLLTALSSTGCEPFRKKFIREKKKDQQSKFVPVLDPVDYAPVTHTPEEKYSAHYSLWKVWQRDFLYVTSEETGDKRQRSTLNEVIAQLGEMEKFVVEEKQAQLDQYIAQLQTMLTEYDKPEPMRNMYTLRKDFESMAKEIQREYKPQAMENYFVK